MGYYIQVAGHHGKAQAIATLFEGEILPSCPESYDEIPEGKALIVVVDNGAFEAAGFAYDAEEFEAFCKNPNDHRPMQYVLIDRNNAEEASGFKKRNFTTV